MEKKMNGGRIIGFGEVTAHRCVVYDSRYLKHLDNDTISIDEIHPLFMLNYDDDDAVSFEMITTDKPIFCIGREGTSHSSLLRDVINLSPNTNVKISHAGRLWLNSKTVILKSTENSYENISKLYRLLYDNNIDITSFSILVKGDAEKKQVVAIPLNDII